MIKIIFVVILCFSFFLIGKFDIDKNVIVPESKKIVKTINKNIDTLKKEYK